MGVSLLVGLFLWASIIFGSIAKASFGRRGVCIGICLLITFLLVVSSVCRYRYSFFVTLFLSEPNTLFILYDRCRVPVISIWREVKSWSRFAWYMHAFVDRATLIPRVTIEKM